MKNRTTQFILFLVMAIMAFPLAGRAQGKIGTININAAIAQSEEGKKVIADLQKKYSPRQQELERLQNEIQGIQDQLTKGQGTMSDDEQRRLSRELEDKQKILKRDTDDAQSDFASDRDDAIRRIGQKMVKVISDYAQQNGYVLVMDNAQAPIYYFAKTNDLTAEVVKRYDAANPVAGAATSSTPAAHPGTTTAKPK